MYVWSMHVYVNVLAGKFCTNVGMARTVYMHRICPYKWLFPCQKYRIFTVYIYMVLANPTYAAKLITRQTQKNWLLFKRTKVQSSRGICGHAV